MAKKIEFEPKLTEEETLQIRDNFVNFYQELDTIQDYFLERKKEKIRRKGGKREKSFSDFKFKFFEHGN